MSQKQKFSLGDYVIITHNRPAIVTKSDYELGLLVYHCKLLDQDMTYVLRPGHIMLLDFRSTIAAEIIKESKSAIEFFDNQMTKHKEKSRNEANRVFAYNTAEIRNQLIGLHQSRDWISKNCQWPNALSSNAARTVQLRKELTAALRLNYSSQLVTNK